MDINTCLATTDAYRDLALFSHIIPAFATLILGIFAFWRAQNRTKAAYFFAFSLALCAWLIGDLIVWTANPYDVVAAFWAPLDLAEITFFLLLLGFIIVDLHPGKIPRYVALALVVAALAPFYTTITGQSVHELYHPECEMLNNRTIENYKIALEVFVLLTAFVLGIRYIYARWNDVAERTRIALITVAVVLFMGIFGGAEYIANSTYIYEIHLYALFTLPLFVLMLTIAITSYGTFRLGDVAVKALFYVFLVLSGTQFFFVNDILGFLLACMSFVVILTLGILLFRSNEREIVARHQIEQLSNEKSEFMSFASHEIRNPITAMRGLASLIYDGTAGEASKQVRESAEKIMVTGNEVLALISEFLDKSKIELGQIAYHMEVFDVGSVLSTLADGFKPSAELKGLTIKKNIDLSAHLAVNADKAKLNEVIGNIIDNSIKYTKSGSVTIGVEKHNDKVLIEVSDTGAGISKETIDKLFKKFSRADAAKANLRGTGLGLFLAKNFVEGMNGRIWVESEGEGKGSRFFVEFPSA